MINMAFKIHNGRQMSDSFRTALFIVLSGGFQDAYTYRCRDAVFANAQTGNIVLMSSHMFSGDWGDGHKLFGDEGTFSGLYNVDRLPGGEAQNFGNKIMTTLGLASVVYTLGMKDAAVFTVKNVTNTKGQTLKDGVWIPAV